MWTRWGWTGVRRTGRGGQIACAARHGRRRRYRRRGSARRFWSSRLLGSWGRGVLGWGGQRGWAGRAGRGWDLFSPLDGRPYSERGSISTGLSRERCPEGARFAFRCIGRFVCGWDERVGCVCLWGKSSRRWAFAGAGVVVSRGQVLTSTIPSADQRRLLQVIVAHSHACFTTPYRVALLCERNRVHYPARRDLAVGDF